MRLHTDVNHVKCDVKLVKDKLGGIRFIFIVSLTQFLFIKV